MNYGNIILASLLALAGTAHAADSVQLTDDEITDVRVECISAGIADEVDDSLMGAFVDTCVKDGLAARQKFKGQQGQATVI
jgi:hypothetical protein